MTITNEMSFVVVFVHAHMGYFISGGSSLLGVLALVLSNRVSRRKVVLEVHNEILDLEGDILDAKNDMHKAKYGIMAVEKNAVQFEERISAKIDGLNKNRMEIAEAIIKALQGDKMPSLKILQQIKAGRDSVSC